MMRDDALDDHADDNLMMMSMMILGDDDIDVGMVG